MADAYARLSGRPGITETPSGGGATYVIPGIAEANGSSVPMVVFTSDVPIVDEGKGTLTAIDQSRLLEAATKHSMVVKRPQMLQDIIRRAFRIATSGRGGAVHVVLPKDVLVELADAQAIYAEPACRQFPSYRTQAPTATLALMRSALVAAKCPFLVAGGGAVLSGASHEITRLAEPLHIPVGTTINGKGSILEAHPWSVGVIGGNGGRPYANDLLAESDCIFYVGTKVNSLVTLNHTNPPVERRTLTRRVFSRREAADWPRARQALRRVCWRRDRATGREMQTVAYAVTSLAPTLARVAQLEAWWRGHWRIENQLHDVRDVTCREDAGQAYVGAIAHVLAALRNGLLSLLRRRGWTNMAAAFRHLAASVSRVFTFLGCLPASHSCHLTYYFDIALCSYRWDLDRTVRLAGKNVTRLRASPRTLEPLEG